MIILMWAATGVKIGQTPVMVVGCGALGDSYTTASLLALLSRLGLFLSQGRPRRFRCVRDY